MNPYLGEFLGTATLMLLGSGVVAGVLLPQSKSQNGG
jgi:glycerol uptake facilitator protein